MVLCVEKTDTISVLSVSNDSGLSETKNYVQKKDDLRYVKQLVMMAKFLQCSERQDDHV